MKGVYIFLADGFEESEALVPVDILRRGGVGVVTVAINECEEDDGDIYCRVVTGSHGIPVVADISLQQFLAEQAAQTEEVTQSDVMIFPGGMPGTVNLAHCTELMDMLRNHWSLGGTMAAICAAPSKILCEQLPDQAVNGVRMTCYDSMEEPLIRMNARYVKDEGVVVDGNYITARGAGYATEFGLAILSHIATPEYARAVAKSIMLE